MSNTPATQIATLFGIGHSNHDMARLCELLRRAGITMLVDVRRFPVSRRWPQYNLAQLQVALAAAGIAYRHLPALGGRRDAIAAPAHSNAGLEDAGLRSYADYAQSASFARAIAELLALAGAAPTAMLCAEADWRNCHRQIIADHALFAGCAVVHLGADGSREHAVMNALARRAADGAVHYPPLQPGLFGDA